jgi:hypothetical protein
MVVTLDEAEVRVGSLKPFRTATGSMKGAPGGADTFGHLPEAYHAEVRDAEYVVYSYATPIAWLTVTGQRVVPDIGYSPTTSQHQYLVKNAWQGTDWVGSTFPARGRQVVRAGGGRRGGGMDDDRYPGMSPEAVERWRQVVALEQESHAAGFQESWELQGDAFSMQASVASPDLDVPWHLRVPARGAGYPPMGERQG